MKEMILQHLVMPSSLVERIGPLYCRSHQTSFPIILDSAECLDLRAHFNMVPIGLLKENGITNVKIVMETEGNGSLSIYTNDMTVPIMEQKITDSGMIVDLPPGELMGITITADNEGCKIIGGHISCLVDEEKEIRLGLVICTYRREDIMIPKTHTIDEYTRANDLNDSLTMIIIDNGSTLDLPDIETIHSKNLGGSAGFAKGMIEAKNRGCSHVILNDDDAIFDPEILFRTLSLLKIMKDEKIIGGTMLSLKRPCVVYEAGGTCDGSELHPSKKDIDLSTIDGNTALSNKEMMDYTGWWYSVFPMSLVEKIGYPLPFFYKEDDVEYGLRTDMEKIAVCGISVWHPDPIYSPSVNYYYVRNRLATLASHELFKRKTITSFISKILLEISAYRYQNADMMILGMKDFLKGPAYIYKKCKEGPLSIKMDYQMLDELRKKGNYTHEPPDSAFILRLMTMNGLFLPSRGSTEKNVWDMETKNFYRMGEILYSVNDSEGFIATRKRSKSIIMIIKTIALWGSVIIKLRKISKKYHYGLKEYSSETKWIEMHNDN